MVFSSCFFLYYLVGLLEIENTHIVERSEFEMVGINDLEGRKKVKWSKTFKRENGWRPE